MPVMARDRPGVRHRGLVVARTRAPVLPSRTRSCTSASACGTARSSSIAAANSAYHSPGTTVADAARAPRCRNSSIAGTPHGVLQRRLGVLQHRPVVRAAQVVAQLDRPHPVEHRGDRQRVAQRLAHLLAAHGDPARCAASTGRTPSPAASDWAISFSWCGKTQVHAAAVDVELRPEVRARHRRALDVPAGAARPHGVGHDGSPGLAPFHSVKSRGSRLPRGRRPRPGCTSSIRWPDSSP